MPIVELVCYGNASRVVYTRTGLLTVQLSFRTGRAACHFLSHMIDMCMVASKLLAMNKDGICGADIPFFKNTPKRPRPELDRFVAILKLSQTFQDQIQGHCLRGIWNSDIHRGLLWQGSRKRYLTSIASTFSPHCSISKHN